MRWRDGVKARREGWWRKSLHAVNIMVVSELVEGIQVPPPQGQELLSNKTKPRSDGDVVILQPPQEPAKVLPFNIANILHLILIGTDRNVLLKKQYVVHLMFTPSAIRRAGIVDAREVCEVTWPHLLQWNAKLKLQPSLCGIPDPQCTLLNGLSWGVQWVGAAGVGVVTRKGDLRVEEHVVIGH